MSFSYVSYLFLRRIIKLVRRSLLGPISTQNKSSISFTSQIIQNIITLEVRLVPEFDENSTITSIIINWSDLTSHPFIVKTAILSACIRVTNWIQEAKDRSIWTFTIFIRNRHRNWFYSKIAISCFCCSESGPTSSSASSSGCGVSESSQMRTWST